MHDIVVTIYDQTIQLRFNVSPDTKIGHFGYVLGLVRKKSIKHNIRKYASVTKYTTT